MLIRPMLMGLPQAPVVTGTTWNPADKSPDWSLTSANRTAVRSAAGTGGTSVRASTFVASGRRYGEMQLEAIFGNLGVGLANSSHDVNANIYPGNDTNGIRYTASGTIIFNSESQASVEQLVAGDVIGFALDRNAGTLGFYRNGVLKYTSGGIPSGALAFIAANTATTGSRVTLRTTAADFTYPVPSGFLPWG